MQIGRKATAAVMVLGLLGSAPAMAVDYDPQNGQGECTGQETPQQQAQCGNPRDPMGHRQPPAGRRLFIASGPSRAGGTGIVIAIGDEGRPNSLARVSAAVGDGNQIVSVYTEDYTQGNIITSLVHAINGDLLGCLLVNGGSAPCNGRPDANRTDIG